MLSVPTVPEVPEVPGVRVLQQPEVLVRGGERGFSLVELVVSTAIMLVITAAIFGLVDPSQGIYRTQPEVADMQQRLRVAANALQEDLLMAGAGTYLGGSGGSLLNILAPVMPVRIGTQNSDIDAGLFYRTDAITVMYVPQTASQCTIRDKMPQTSAEIKVNAQPGCPVDDQLCGFKEGMRVVIFDETGAWDPFTVTRVQESALHLQHRDDDFSKAYDKGAQIAAVTTSSYYLKSDATTDTFQLRMYDGYQTDTALVDNVVGLTFSYLGDPRPPALLKQVTDGPGPWTTYGPPPPPLANTFEPWPEGENCAFKVDEDTGLHVPRLADLAPGSDALVPLTEAMLTDGPWCPGPESPTRYDADLLRVRTVGVRLRVQVASATMRGPAGVLFSRGGTSKSGMSMVPDQEVRFDVTPRNLNLRR